MKIVAMGAVIAGVVLLAAWPATSWAQGATAPSAPAAKRADVAPPRGFDAKVAYCKTCHGDRGQGYRGAVAIPRLAGQQVEYFDNQLNAFLEHRRDNPFMYQAAHVMSHEMHIALGQYFHRLNPKPTGSGPAGLVAAGRKIFEAGVPQTGVPPCASCHGPDAHGNGIFPRLAGQSFDYIVRQLTEWENLRGRDPSKPDNAEMMKPITHGLTRTEIKEVAAYLDRLD